MFDAQLGAGVLVGQLAGSLFTEEAVARKLALLVGVAGDPAVERVAIVQVVAFEGDGGGFVELPAQHGSDVVALTLDVVAEAVAALGYQVQAVGEGGLFVQRTSGVQSAATQAFAVDLAAQHGAALGLRLFADDVEGAARIAAAVEHGRRATQHFDTLDGAGVGHVRIATVDGETVAVELLAVEAADEEFGQALPAEVVAALHAAGVVERIFQAHRADVLYHLRRHHADRLRRVMNGGVGPCRAGRAGGAIALYWPVGAFGRCGDLHFLERQRRRGGVVGVGGERAGEGRNRKHRDDKAPHRKLLEGERGRAS